MFGWSSFDACQPEELLSFGLITIETNTVSQVVQSFTGPLATQYKQLQCSCLTIVPIQSER